MIELFPFLIDLLNVLFDLQLLFSTRNGIRHQKFAIKSSNFLIILKKLVISSLKFLLF